MSVSGDNMTREQRLYTKALAKADEHIASLQRRIAELEAKSDASAGLIEAAEWHEELAKEKLKQAQQVPEAKKRRFLDISFFHDECASAIRARAVDRSRK